MSTEAKGGLTSLSSGLAVSYRIKPQISFIANFGVSRTTSELRSITTTAPISPSLTPGKIDTEVWSFAYRVGKSYEKIWGPVALGSQLTYGSTSFNPEAEIKDIALGLFVKLYHFKVSQPNDSPEIKE